MTSTATQHKAGAPPRVGVPRLITYGYLLRRLWPSPRIPQARFLVLYHPRRATVSAVLSNHRGRVRALTNECTIRLDSASAFDVRGQRFAPTHQQVLIQLISNGGVVLWRLGWRLYFRLKLLTCRRSSATCSSYRKPQRVQSIFRIPIVSCTEKVRTESNFSHTTSRDGAAVSQQYGVLTQCSQLENAIRRNELISVVNAARRPLPLHNRSRYNSAVDVCLSSNTVSDLCLHVVRPQANDTPPVFLSSKPCMAIEHGLMRSMKTSGGLTRGRGMIADVSINCDETTEVGRKAINSLTGKNFSTVKLHRHDKTHPISAMNRTITFQSDTVEVNAHQLFSRIVLIKIKYDFAGLLQYELAPWPLALFDDATGDADVLVLTTVKSRFSETEPVVVVGNVTDTLVCI
ncbi:hypothetical protein PR048_014312 [Dryococelus australis]|uniref:Uncharacterized protein n=1 Tax=Dryococelus australis TaxID=614101 RepID=A0ABQ9HE92_9NEOP|nr:hypothetical protein PR048_014312 [Dryococelus australis]